MLIVIILYIMNRKRNWSPNLFNQNSICRTDQNRMQMPHIHYVSPDICGFYKLTCILLRKTSKLVRRLQLNMALAETKHNHIHVPKGEWIENSEKEVNMFLDVDYCQPVHVQCYCLYVRLTFITCYTGIWTHLVWYPRCIGLSSFHTVT